MARTEVSRKPSSPQATRTPSIAPSRTASSEPPFAPSESTWLIAAEASGAIGPIKTTPFLPDMKSFSSRLPSIYAVPLAKTGFQAVSGAGGRPASPRPAAAAALADPRRDRAADRGARLHRRRDRGGRQGGPRLPGH